MVAVGCEEVWQEVSNYLDGEVDPGLRLAIEDHVGQCQRCTAVMTGTRNILALYGSERLFEAPVGYSWRLRRKISQENNGRRRFIFGWAAAMAALVLVGGTYEVADWKSKSGGTRSWLAKPDYKGPGDLAVFLNVRGKLFHVKGCPFMKEDDGVRQTTAAEAVKEGYAPCVRCMSQYIASSTAQGGVSAQG